MALYSRKELTQWLCEPATRRAMENLMERGRPYKLDWDAIMAVAAAPTLGADEVLLSKLTDDETYKDAVMGRSHHR